MSSWAEFRNSLFWFLICHLLVDTIQCQTIRWFHYPAATEVVFAKGKGLWSLGEAVDSVQSSHGQVKMAMNGGMFHANGDPVGLFIEQGEELFPANMEQGRPGNFFLQPNGVFGITEDGRFLICKTNQAAAEEWRYATQSGPMLLISGTINGLFRQQSEHLKIRNGVGVDSGGNVFFALSSEPVSFYAFASAFKEKGCTDALYLDGVVSRVYDPSDAAPDEGGEFGVVLVVLAPGIGSR